MSQAVYPTLPGLTWDITRTPTWSTTVKQAVSQREYRVSNASYPLYVFTLTYSCLRQKAGLTELATLAGFYNARQGSFDSFLFEDPDDCTAAAQVIGVGDGANKLFQLVRTWGGFLEPVFDIQGAQQLFLNGTLTAAYTIGPTGLVTFTAAPGAGVVVTWTGRFYRRVRFLTDSVAFNKMMYGLWEVQAGNLSLQTCKP